MVATEVAAVEVNFLMVCRRLEFHGYLQMKILEILSSFLGSGLKPPTEIGLKESSGGHLCQKVPAAIFVLSRCVGASRQGIANLPPG